MPATQPLTATRPEPSRRPPGRPIEPAGPTPGQIELRFPTAQARDDDWLFAFCQVNPALRIERTSQGDLAIMSPTGAATGARNSELNRHVANWAVADGRGVVFDSSTGFLLPNGAMRSPDLAWITRRRLAELSPRQKRQFLPLAPDLIIELGSPSDTPERLHAKMYEWRDNGVRLGWLILPEQRQVWRYAPDAEPIQLDDPVDLRDEILLPGLVLPLGGIWEPGF